MLLARKEPIKEAPERHRHRRAGGGGVKEWSGGSGRRTQPRRRWKPELGKHVRRDDKRAFPPAAKSDTAALRSNYIAWC